MQLFFFLLFLRLHIIGIRQINCAQTQNEIKESHKLRKSLKKKKISNQILWVFGYFYLSTSHSNTLYNTKFQCVVNLIYDFLSRRSKHQRKHRQEIRIKKNGFCAHVFSDCMKCVSFVLFECLFRFCLRQNEIFQPECRLIGRLCDEEAIKFFKCMKQVLNCLLILTYCMHSNI